MTRIETDFKDLFVLVPDVYNDHRGYFMETYNTRAFIQLGLDYFFIQDNEAFSSYGTVRGLHYQTEKHAQAKLVRATYGEVLDVAVDLRKRSSTYGQYFSIVLSGENKKQLLIPRGFAHGYSVLSESAIFNYKCDNFYNKNAESGIHPLDQGLEINWQVPIEKMVLSEKDKAWPLFT